MALTWELQFPNHSKAEPYSSNIADENPDNNYNLRTIQYQNLLLPTLEISWQQATFFKPRANTFTLYDLSTWNFRYNSNNLAKQEPCSCISIKETWKSRSTEHSSYRLAWSYPPTFRNLYHPSWSSIMRTSQHHKLHLPHLSSHISSSLAPSPSCSFISRTSRQ